MQDRGDLRKQLLLSDLDDAELGAVGRLAAAESYVKGRRVFSEGDPTTGLYLIRSGKIEISKTTPDGWRQTLAVLGEHHFFGELAVIEGRPAHSTIATAIDAAELYRIGVEDFRKLEASHPALMYKVMRTIARMASRNVHTMNEKLIKALISY